MNQQTDKSLPDVVCVTRYEDIFSVDVVVDLEKVNPNAMEFAESVDNWTFRMN